MRNCQTLRRKGGRLCPHLQLNDTCLGIMCARINYLHIIGWMETLLVAATANEEHFYRGTGKVREDADGLGAIMCYVTGVLTVKK